MTRESRWFRPAVWGLYTLVVLEFLFMISPFALHFYSAYSPGLNALIATPATAWLTQFFLPHFSTTNNPWLNALKPIGFGVAGLGLLLFMVGAIQVYGAKLLRRGAVTGGLYRFVRHPQYLALAALGIGVTLIWPRFLVLVTLVSMLFLYFALARREERECLERFGDGYGEYQERTGMILPRFVPSDGADEEYRPIGWSRGLGLYGGALALTLLGAFSMRWYSLDQVSSLYRDEVAILSPAILQPQELREAYRTALLDPGVQELHQQEARLLAYVVPVDWFLPDLPLHTEEEIRRVGGGHATGGSREGVYKLLFARPRLHAEDAAGRDIVLKAHGLEPLMIVRVDLLTGDVIGHDETPDHVIWGDIPTPLF